MSIRISDDPAELDRARVRRWIVEQAYWGTDRDPARQDAAIDASWCFGAYDDDGTQLGFARLVTDKATFAWLCDVFVDDAARGRGVGKALMTRIVAELDALGIPRSILATADAHGLYAQYGYAVLAQPERWMARYLPGSTPRSAATTGQ